MKMVHKFIEHINEELEGAKEYAEVLSQCAIKDLSELPYDTEFVEALIDMLINRQK